MNTTSDKEHTQHAAIDIHQAKNRLVVVSPPSGLVLTLCCSREQLFPALEDINPYVIGLESSNAGHLLAHALIDRGYNVLLASLPPPDGWRCQRSRRGPFFRAYQIALAIGQPEAGCPAIKSTEQIDTETLQQFKEKFYIIRCGLLRSIRDTLNDYGIYVPDGSKGVRRALQHALESEFSTSAKMTTLLELLVEELASLDSKIGEINQGIRSPSWTVGFK